MTGQRRCLVRDHSQQVTVKGMSRHSFRQKKKLLIYSWLASPSSMRLASAVEWIRNDRTCGVSSRRSLARNRGRLKEQEVLKEDVLTSNSSWVKSLSNVKLNIIIYCNQSYTQKVKIIIIIITATTTHTHNNLPGFLEMLWCAQNFLSLISEHPFYTSKPII